MSGAARPRLGVAVAAVLSTVMLVGLTGCAHRVRSTVRTEATSPPHTTRACGRFTIGYDPHLGYEASPFIVGALARTELGCKVRYVVTNPRSAWRLAASGAIDVYLDDYGNVDLHARYARPQGPVTIVGPTGMTGDVDLVVPDFMEDRGVRRARDLVNTRRAGWGVTTPAITTVPELKPLADALVGALRLDYTVIVSTPARNDVHGVGQLYGRWRLDDEGRTPAVYLVEGPVGLVTGSLVEIPASAGARCQRNAVASLCRFGTFPYYKIASSRFARSGSPAYRLAFRYHLATTDVATIAKIVSLSGNQVRTSDLLGWINTHRSVWRSWLR